MSAIKFASTKKKEAIRFFSFFSSCFSPDMVPCASFCVRTPSHPLFQPKKEKTPGKSKQVQANKAAAGAKSGKAGKSKAKKKVRLVFGFCSSREIIILTQLQNPEMV